jgi:hypothetical protein
MDPDLTPSCKLQGYERRGGKANLSMINMLRSVVMRGVFADTRETSYSHVECLLHDYGIPASEVMAIV